MNKKKKTMRLRHANCVDLTRTFSANLLGGPRSFGDANALESFSNEVTPTIRCLHGFVLIVEVEDEPEDTAGNEEGLC